MASYVMLRCKRWIIAKCLKLNGIKELLGLDLWPLLQQLMRIPFNDWQPYNKLNAIKVTLIAIKVALTCRTSKGDSECPHSIYQNEESWCSIRDVRSQPFREANIGLLKCGVYSHKSILYSFSIFECVKALIFFHFYTSLLLFEL